jgi:chorismate mutase
MEKQERNENMVERFQFNSPFVIAGPCSAETEEQVLKIAHELKDSDVSVLEQEYGSQEHVQEDLKVLEK